MSAPRKPPPVDLVRPEPGSKAEYEALWWAERGKVPLVGGATLLPETASKAVH